MKFVLVIAGKKIDFITAGGRVSKCIFVRRCYFVDDGFAE